MKVALIAPSSLVKRYSVCSDYHLLLAQLVVENPGYYIAYKELREAQPSHYFIMDNGAYECQASIAIKMCEVALDLLRADEFVLPDKLRDARMTIDLVDHFFEPEYFRGFNDRHPHMRFQVVPQGRNVQELLYCFRTLANKAIKGEIYYDVVGLPKHTGIWTENVGGRARLLTTVVHEMGYVNYKSPIHMLGTMQVREAKYINSVIGYNKKVRSIDSSLPFVYAYYGLDLENLDIPNIKTVHRPDNYFDLPKDNFNINLVDHNVEVFLNWCND